jgi:hypothetical protein
MVTSMKKLRETERLLIQTRLRLDELCCTATQLCTVMERTAELGSKLPDLDSLHERLHAARGLSAALNGIAAAS